MSSILAAALVLQLAGPVQTEPPPPPPSRTPDEASGGIRLTAGVHELRHADSASGEAGVEVRLPWRAFGVVGPVAGVTVTSTASTFAYSGLALDLPVGSRVRVTPSFAAGLYARGGGKDLNNPVQFRTGLELAIRISPRARVGVEVTHLSSGGLATPNPGVESLVLVYEIPF